MGTMTAQILVGNSHMYEGGIIPSHQLFLSENSRSAWILNSMRPSTGEKPQAEKQPIVWIPTLEHMLEDALVLIMLHAIKDEKACTKARELIGWNQESYVELYSYSEKTRQQLYSYVKERYEQLGQNVKLTLNIFNGSSMLSRWEKLRDYPFEAEVTMPKFERSWNVFSQHMMIREGADL